MSHPRSPLVEEFLRQGGFLIPGTARKLSPTEKGFIRDVFKQSLDLEPIRIVFGTAHVNDRAYTLGNNIRAPKSIPLESRVLIHELTHVWQFQTMGSEYLSDSILHQIKSGQGAYNTTIVPKQSFLKYTAEQQATIIEGYFADDPKGWHTDPDVLRMLEELRAKRPMTQDDHYDDLLWGRNGPPKDVRPPSRPGEDITPIVPLIRWNFDIL